MARTTSPKPKKKRRTIKEILLKKISVNTSRRNIPAISNWGGMIVNPPNSCSKRFRAPDGGMWTDLGKCQTSCPDKCEKYKWMSKTSDKEKAIEWKNCGVKSFTFGQYNQENV